MRVFYVIMIQQPVIVQYLDAIRFIANPLEKRSAHITVRGPYRQRYNMSRLNSLIKGSAIKVHGGGKFFGPNQNTVFLHCDSPELKKIWHKPDYNVKYNPHITIYDGNSKDFASRLLQIIRKFQLNFQFHSGSLLPLESAKGQICWDLTLSFNHHLISSIVGHDISAAHVNNMVEEQRLGLIEKIYQRLCSVTDSEYSCQWEEIPQKNASL